MNIKGVNKKYTNKEKPERNVIVFNAIVFTLVRLNSRNPFPLSQNTMNLNLFKQPDS